MGFAWALCSDPFARLAEMQRAIFSWGEDSAVDKISHLVGMSNIKFTDIR